MFRRIPIVASAGAAAAALALGMAASGATATSGPDASAPPWMAGLQARSEALNQTYGLGEYATTADARSAALNQASGSCARASSPSGRRSR